MDSEWYKTIFAAIDYRHVIAEAADLAHNHTIESLIADCQFNVDACEALGETNFGVMWEGRVTWLKQQLRPIAEVGEDV